MKKIIFYIVPFLCMLCACSQKEGLVSVDELGVKQREVSLDCAEGVYDVQVLCDGAFEAVLSDESWISFADTQQRCMESNGDAVLSVRYEYNRGLARSASMTITHGRKSLKVEFTQDGVLSSEISFSQHSVTMGAEASEAAVKFLSVYKDEDLVFDVSYEGEGGWIQDISKENNFVTFNCIANPAQQSRYATVSVSLTGSSAASDMLQVCQMGAGMQLQELTISQLKSMAAKEPAVLDQPYVVEGVVIGDDACHNGGENINISASLQDVTLSARTMYIQNADASAGFKLVFASASDNILKRYDKVRILLEGTTLKMAGGNSENDPLRCEITDVTCKNILSSNEGSAYDLTAKRKHISELTDDDIYTYVTLADCEIPVRKGPFVPIDLRHRKVIHSYPMILRDIDGGSTHIMTNLGASWERDGMGLPQGSGSVSGVVVHEYCDNFEWDTAQAMRQLQEGILPDYVTCVGNLGRYQIRPFSKEEIAISDNFDDGFSELIMEIRYYNKSNYEIVKNVNGNYIYSTYPLVPDPIYDSSVKGKMYVVNKDGAFGNTALFRDWTHVGPYVGGVITVPENGNGVNDFYDVPTEFTPYASVGTTGLVMKSSAWYAASGWCPEKYWCASFSTEGLTAANFPLSVQIGAISGLGQTVGAPRYWVLEYSVDGKTWSKVQEYTVPDFPILSNRKPWQCPGPKYMSFNLPENSRLLDKTEVFVRLRPTVNQAGTPNDYDGGSIVENREAVLNYFAIRYNK